MILVSFVKRMALLLYSSIILYVVNNNNNIIIETKSDAHALVHNAKKVYQPVLRETRTKR